MLKELLRTAQNTEYGQQYDFHSLTTPEQYRERLPIVHYEDINELITEAAPAGCNRRGQQGSLWSPCRRPRRT